MTDLQTDEGAENTDLQPVESDTPMTTNSLRNVKLYTQLIIDVVIT